MLWQNKMKIKLNNLICPYCNNTLPLFDKFSVHFKELFHNLKNWSKKTESKCPNCNKSFQTKISKKIAVFILPLTILIMIFELEFIKSFEFMGSISGIIIAGALGGLTAGIGIRLCYVPDEKHLN
jgi:uncharacterized Zn-finger protein